MKFLKSQLSRWRIVLFVGVMALAIPIAARLSPTVTAVEERQAPIVQQTAINIEHSETKHGGDSKVAVGKRVAQGYYWDRRRQYWEDRLEDDLDNEDEGTAGDKEDTKAAKDDEADDDGLTDDEYDRIEKRREYWRQQLEDEDW
jgi:hypothetical protein